MKKTARMSQVAITIIAVGAALTVSLQAAPAQPSQPDPAQAARMKWFVEARFGIWPIMFPGAYTQYHKGMDVTKTESVAANWNPSKFDADAMVKLAKDSGAKYFCFNAVWCDSFALWDTKITEHKITNIPYGKNLLLEVATACKKHDLPMFIYLGEKAKVGSGKAMPGADISPYADHPMELMQELMTVGKPVGCKTAGFWFDSEYHTPEALELARKINPDVIYSDRVCFERGNNKHDTVPGWIDTPHSEQAIWTLNRKGSGYAQMAMTPFGWWYWNRHVLFLGRKDILEPGSADFQPAVKDFTKFVLRIVIGSVANDQNCLLSYPPAPDGSTPEMFAAVLREVGEWMKVYGGSIYSTRGGPYYQVGANGYFSNVEHMFHADQPPVIFQYHCGATCKANTVYLHLFLEPGKKQEVVLPPLAGAVKKATFLKDGAAATVVSEKEGLKVTIPADYVDPRSESAVVALEMDQPALGIPVVKVPLLKPAIVFASKTAAPATPAPAAGAAHGKPYTGQLKAASETPEFVKLADGSGWDKSLPIIVVTAEGKDQYSAQVMVAGKPFAYAQPRPMSRRAPDFHEGLATDADAVVALLGDPDRHVRKLPGGATLKTWTFCGPSGKELDVEVCALVFGKDGKTLGYRFLYGKLAP